MKIAYTLPSNDAFFSRYANLMPTLNILGFLAQIISVMTEFWVVYALVYATAKDFTPQTAPVIAAIGAVVGTAFLEVGLRKFTPYGVRAIIYRRYRGEDRLMSLFILLAGGGLILSSGYLSFRGSQHIVAAIAPEAEQQEEGVALDAFEKKQRKIIGDYRRDSSALVIQNKEVMASRKQSFESRIQQQREEYQKYESREQRSGKSYRTAKQRIRDKIAALEVARDQYLADANQEKAIAMQALVNRRNKRLAAAEMALQKARKKIATLNADALAQREQMVASYGGGLGWFTIFGLCVFVVAITMKELHQKGSGIEQVALPNQYFFSQGLLGEWWNAIWERMQYKARAAIRKLEMGTPMSPPPLAPEGLYDLGQLKQPRFSFRYEEIPEEERQVVIPAIKRPETLGKQSLTHVNDELELLEQQAISYVKASLEFLKAKLEEQAREMELKADDVIRAYLGEQATDVNIKKWRLAIAAFLKGEGVNPFRKHHQRSTIGFGVNRRKQAEKEPLTQESPASVTNASVNNVMDPRSCKHCGQTYQPSVKWQKFCKEKCRQDFHAGKHGQAFDPKLYNKHKSKR